MGSDFDRMTHMATARIEQPLNKCLIADGAYRYFWDDYDNPNSLDFAGRPRVDRRSVVRAGLQYTRNDHASVRADYTFINSQSNTENLFGVKFFEYDRHLLSVQYVYNF